MTDNINATSQFIHLTPNRQSVQVFQTTTGAIPASNEHIFGGFNLGVHVKDNSTQVHKNRCALLSSLQQDYPHLSQIHWLNQVHGDSVYHVTQAMPTRPVDADAHFTSLDNVALAIMTADCVPIMISDDKGDIIGAVHAGWQGLAKDIITKTVQKMLEISQNKTAENWQAWIGACIAQDNYEVDSRVKDNVLKNLQFDDKFSQELFRPNPHRIGHYFANLAKVAEIQLARCGITQVHQSGLDSYADERFYSYRKQTQEQLPSTGRMAMLIFKGDVK